MIWYYAQGREQIGPIEEVQFQSLVSSGVITPETLVWHEGMSGWRPCAEVIPPAPPGAAESGSLTVQIATCRECGNLFPTNIMVPYGDGWVCASCKPIFFQRLKEGAALPGTWNYGGFWIRFVAKFIDGVITNVASSAVSIALNLALGAVEAQNDFLIMGLNYGVGLLLGITYSTLFVGAFAATPGKMVFGLKIVRPDGDRVTYARAFARHFAEMLSGLILGIGYIIAAFDDEKRALHDRICDTRVVRK